MEKRLNALPESHADHAGNGNDFHGYAHGRHRHIPVLCHMAVDQNLRNAHQQRTERRGNADDQNTAADFFFYREIPGVNAETGFAAQEIKDVIRRPNDISDHCRDRSTSYVPAKA